MKEIPPNALLLARKRHFDMEMGTRVLKDSIHCQSQHLLTELR